MLLMCFLMLVGVLGSRFKKTQNNNKEIKKTKKTKNKKQKIKNKKQKTKNKKQKTKNKKQKTKNKKQKTKNKKQKTKNKKQKTKNKKQKTKNKKQKTKNKKQKTKNKNQPLSLQDSAMKDSIVHALHAGSNVIKYPKDGPVEWARGKPYIMGLTAEFLVQKYGFTREQQDEVALRSQNNAENASTTGIFDSEITPVTIKGRKV